jgi:hypothetical protein
VINRRANSGTSRFSRLEVPYMPWFFDRTGPTSDSHNATGRIAFHQSHNVGTPDKMITRLNSPAYTYPCQRFACTLTSTHA